MKAEEEVRKAYQELYNEFGVDPRSLGWDKGKQFLRFENLTQDWELSGSRILDVGSGFGDFIKFLENVGIKEYQYCGIDIVEDFVLEAKKIHKEKQAEFLHCSIFDLNDEERYDYALASGTFNHRMENVDPYEYLEKVIAKMYAVSSVGFAIDLLSDKVDYRYDHNYNYDPARVLDILYGFSRRVVMRNDRFPFEFSVHCFKDDSFEVSTTIFTGFSA